MIVASSTRIQNIPCLILREMRFGCGPLLLHYHAWAEDKGNLLSPDITLVQAASEGFTVICPDCPEHGGRKTAAQFRKTMNGWAFICAVIEQAKQESGKLLESLFDLPFVSSRHGVISGVSMGALIAQMIFAQEQRLGALVSVVGRSSLLQYDPWCRQAQLGNWASKWGQKQAMQAHPKRFIGRSILFLDGAKDTLCPPVINAKTVKLINRVGGQAIQIIDRNAGHCFSLSMRHQFINWIRMQCGINERFRAMR
ncbi:MAG: prolyl oligopeptidase family serine peptidase [Phycisphaerales bacterium]|jgi:dienelactone hydrolase|nr:prolyl oligopeptidase family serine peptidase [Phycisphaerales bacterium]